MYSKVPQAQHDKRNKHETVDNNQPGSVAGTPCSLWSRILALWQRCHGCTGSDEVADGGDGVRHSRGFGAGSYAAVDDHCHLPKASIKTSRHAISKLLVACVLCTLFMVAEVVGGYLANSIAIMSDAAHMFSDLTSFIVSLAAIYLSMRPASRQMNYGYHRAEVLGAVISVLMIWVITGVLVYAAIQRVVSMDFKVEADIMIIVSAVGVVMNIVLGIVLHTGSGGHGHSHGLGSGQHHHEPPNTHVAVTVDGTGGTVAADGPHLSNGSGSSPVAATSSRAATAGGGAGHSHSHNNINIRAAFIHVVGDLIQSIGVLVAAYIIRFYPEYKIADPICTFLFSVLVVITTIPIIRELGRVLMEGVPPGVDYAAILAHLAALPGVKMVHSLHVWSLTVDKNACSVHLAVGIESEPDAVLRAAQRVIRSRHHVYHTTIQVERYDQHLMDNCNECQPLP